MDVLGLSKNGKSIDLVINDLGDDLNSSKSSFKDLNENITSLDTGTPLPSRSIQNGSLSLPYGDEQGSPEPTDHNELEKTVFYQEKNTAVAQAMHSEVKINDETPRSISADDDGILAKRDQNRILVKEYFHDLLLYINKNDATLENDKDGDLTFFVRQMPAEELDTTFPEWLEKKMSRVRSEFLSDADEKLNQLKEQFEHARAFISALDDDDAITNIASSLGLL